MVSQSKSFRLFIDTRGSEDTKTPWVEIVAIDLCICIRMFKVGFPRLSHNLNSAGAWVFFTIKIIFLMNFTSD